MLVERKILVRELHVKNREGYVDVISFPVLTVMIDEKYAMVLNSNINSSFDILIYSYTIEQFREEIPSTLYCDKPLYLSFADKIGYSLCTH